MKIEFTPAVRRKTRARIALSGPSGSGKTYTALTWAHVLAPGSIALIDTEKESADGYEGLNGWKWGRFKPASYEPELLIEALAAAAAAGIECVVIDSLSHFWMGAGGVLEQVDNSAKRSGSASNWGGWKEVRPVERRMIDAITGYPGHVIVTMRTKTEWVVQDNAKGKKEPKKLGTKPEQRDNIEYEFSVVGEMDIDNVLTISKTRVPPLKRAVITEPGPAVAQTILDWLNDGDEALPDLNAYRDRAISKHATREDLLTLLADVEAAHVARATVMDDEGETVTLGDLILRKGRALTASAAADPAPSPSATPAGDTSARPAPQTGQRSPAGSAQQSAGDAFEDAAPAGPPVPAPLEPGDPWALKIGEIHTADDAGAAEAEVKKLHEAGETGKERTDQILHWIRVKAAPMRSAAKSARTEQKPASEQAGDRASADAWCADFIDRLYATPLEGLTGMRGEVGRAVAARTITPEDGNAMSTEVAKRRKQLEQQPAEGAEAA